MVAKLLALLAVTAGLGATAAVAATSRSDDKPVPPAPTAVAAAPQGYTVKMKGPIAAPAGTVTHTSIRCPRSAGLDLGGGALVASDSTQVSLATSSPSGGAGRLIDDRIYSASVVNASSDATSFRVYAICSNPQSSWLNGEMGLFNVAPHSLGSDTTHTCNLESMPMISGGLQIAGKSLQATLHDSRPTLDNGWSVRVNNNSGTMRNIYMWGVCQPGLGAHVVLGTPVSNPPLTQTVASAMCDTGVPLGGGVGASSDSTLVSVNSSLPITGGWEIYENNGSLGLDTVRAWVVCSG
jgi:hypothetical protein